MDFSVSATPLESMGYDEVLRGTYFRHNIYMPSERAEYFREYHARTRKDYYRRKKRSILAAGKRYRKTAAGKASQLRNTYNQRTKKPEAYKARYIAYSAIKRGILVKQPCEVCRSPHVEAHHADYSQPLAVSWLCRQHHREAHSA